MKKILSLIFTLLMATMLHCQSLLFVSPDGNDSQNGQSWATAKATISGALTTATSGSTICLKTGIYSLSSELTVPNGVTIRGGFSALNNGTDTTRWEYPGKNENWTNSSMVSIITGNGNYRLFTVQEGGRIESCILKYGYSDSHGGGLLLNGGTASHCVITQCTAHNENSLNATGGAVYMQNNAQLLNCVICYNRADNGYGMAGNSGNAINNTITLNFGTNCGTVSDFDGNTYPSIAVGPQCWMRENLRTTHFADGTPITQGDSLSTTVPLYYNAGSSGTETHIMGLLYNIQAARRGSQDVYSEGSPSGIQGICPTGWHLPSNAEFEAMLAYLAYDDLNNCNGQTTQIGKSLASQNYWNTSTNACDVGNDLSSNNHSGFNAQAAGYFNGSFTELYSRTCFWTSSRSDNVSSRCTYRFLQFDSNSLGNSYFTSNYACSVRCVKD